MKLYSLTHEHELYEGYKDQKQIGIYSSVEDAKAAIERLKTADGFKDNPDNFFIREFEVGKAYCSEGFTPIKT